MLAALATAATSYGRVGEHEAQQDVVDACARCSARLGHALGDEWTSCVVQELLTTQETAKEAGRRYFPMVPHDYQPLQPKERAFGNGELFKHLLRNCTCDVDDGGSPPIRSMTWEYEPPDPCAGGIPPPFSYTAGFLPAGNDLPVADDPMTEAAAMKQCEKMEGCAGFTFSGSRADKKAKHTMHFKSRSEGANAADGWHAWVRGLALARRRPSPRPRAPPPRPPPAPTFAARCRRCARARRSCARTPPSAPR
jgi:hypothetical protein